MTKHFHGTPITPMSALYEVAGASFCVSYYSPQDVKRCHDIGEEVCLDPGEYSFWMERLKKGVVRTEDERSAYRAGYYKWSDRWLDYPATWAMVADEIDAPSQIQDSLIAEWPHERKRSAPIWHMDEPIVRLLRLIEQDWRCVCIGSTAEYRVVLSEAWEQRMDEVWEQIGQTFGRRVPPIHMLRGMQCCGLRWPFASVDSTDVAQNHNRPQNTAKAMVDRWDAVQCPGAYSPRDMREQLEIRMVA